ncbi:MAG: GerMN domain-containing protein [Ilumatobacteraceae bacterium]
MSGVSIKSLAIVTLLSIAGCSVPTSSEFEAIPPTEIPFDLNAPSTTAAATTSTTTTTLDPNLDSAKPEVVSEIVDLYFVSSNNVVRTQRNITSPATATQTLASLITGPPNDGTSVGLRSALPNSFTATVDVSRGVATIDAASSFLTNLSPGDQKLAIAQLVLTLTSRPGIGQVLFSVDGSPIAVPRGRGDLAPAGQSVSFDDYTKLIIQNSGG